MKKLALLMSSLLVVGATASAKEVVTAPVVQEEPKVVEVVVIKEVEKKNTGFRATGVSQVFGFEDWNQSSNNTVYVENAADFAYGANSEWTFGFMARKGWNSNFNSNQANISKDTLRGKEQRVQLRARRNFKFSEGSFAIGPRWRGYQTADRLYIDLAYSYAPTFLADYGIAFSGSGAPEWRFIDGRTEIKDSAKNGKVRNNLFGGEFTPLIVSLGSAKVGTVGPLRVGYYIAYFKGMEGNDERQLNHQVRAYLPLWKNDQWNLNLEQRFFINKNSDDGFGQTKYGIDTRTDGNFSHYQTHLKADYKYSNNLTLSLGGVFGYGKWQKGTNGVGATEKDATGIYKEITAGWAYKF